MMVHWEFCRKNGSKNILCCSGLAKASKINCDLSKYHMSVIDELYDNRSEEELVVRLEEKYEQLRDFKQIKEIPIPEHLRNILRPYQEHGYYWLNYLSEIGWGGILADDMGLGKTVQALSFLHYYKHHHAEIAGTGGLSYHPDV